jgi:molybdopterin/thiamine biosynthesis adenylyltransferase
MERQVGLWGKEGQECLRFASVAVGGLGGIGAISALMLAKAGVGRVVVCDRDRYELANVVEQAFANHDTVGRAKSDVAYEEMKRHGPYTVVEAFSDDLSTAKGADRLVQGVDVLVSAVDNAAARIALGRAAKEKGVPMVVAANVGWNILHTVYFPGADHYGTIWRDVEGICWRKDCPDMDDSGTRQVVEREWAIWVVVMAGFRRSELRRYLEGDLSYLWYAAPPAYFAASLGISDCLKVLTGLGACTVFPDIVYYDLGHNRSLTWSDFARRRASVRAAWEAGMESVLDVAEEWTP